MSMSPQPFPWRPFSPELCLSFNIELTVNFANRLLDKRISNPYFNKKNKLKNKVGTSSIHPKGTANSPFIQGVGKP